LAILLLAICFNFLHHLCLYVWCVWWGVTARQGLERMTRLGESRRARAATGDELRGDQNSDTNPTKLVCATNKRGTHQ